MSIKLNANSLQLKLSLFTDQTLYFLFKFRRGRVIKYKPQGIYLPPAQGDMFSKRTKRKIK